MSSFFYQSAQTLLNQYADRFPLTENHPTLFMQQWWASCLSPVADVPRQLLLEGGCLGEFLGCLSVFEWIFC